MCILQHYNVHDTQNLHSTLVVLQQSQEGCVCHGPSAIQDHHVVKHVRAVCHNVSGRGEEVCATVRRL